MTIELLNVDCMDYMAKQPDNIFDLMIADPPYFDGPNKLGYYGATVTKTGVIRKGYKTIGSWNSPTEEYFGEVQRISRNQIIWGINYYDIKNIGSGRIIWDKCNNESSFSDCEIAYCSCHTSVRMFPFMWNGFMQGKDTKNGRIMQGNKKSNEKRIHPCQKPVKLYDWLLSKYAKKGQYILDTHLGSGSSAIAAHYFGCDFVGCEIDQYYYQAAKKRFNKETLQMTLDFPENKINKIVFC